MPSSCALLGGFLQSVRGFRCYDSIAPNAKCQRVLVLALCLVLRSLLLVHFFRCSDTGDWVSGGESVLWKTTAKNFLPEQVEEENRPFQVHMEKWPLKQR